MKHEFIIISYNEIPEQTTYNLKNGHEICIVDDEAIVNNILFLKGFKTFKVSFKNPGEGLDYHGNTIIPIGSIEKFISNVKKAQNKFFNTTIYKQLEDLVLLCEKAKTEEKYIVHFGL